MTSSLPVLLYHGINPRRDPINVPPERFEEHLRDLRLAGYRGVSLDEAARCLIHGEELPAGSLLITFDDGYLDNWVYALPLLRKYGHKAVVFVVVDRLETGGSTRPSLEDVWAGRIVSAGLPRVDEPFVQHETGHAQRADAYLNWEEARALERSGHVRVAAHSLSHNVVFTGPEFDGLYNPLAMARNQDRLPMDVPYGFPRFKTAPGLAAPAFLPSPEVFDLVRRMVPQDPVEAKAFFGKPDNVAAVRESLGSIPGPERGRMETEAQYLARLEADFRGCKARLESELGREQEAFCWPWGSWSPLALAMAKRVGFSLFFTTTGGANRPGRSPDAVRRFKVKDRPSKWLLSRTKI
jgi:peptidoglycan/xylan/chitin deacetylase (PgdA/CDA1 family)